MDFVWFLISEEDKRSPTSIEYWFRCMDLDGDGIISMYEMEYFYEEMVQRMEAMGIETLPFEDCLCQVSQGRSVTEGELPYSSSNVLHCRPLGPVITLVWSLNLYRKQGSPIHSLSQGVPSSVSLTTLGTKEAKPKISFHVTHWDKMAAIFQTVSNAFSWTNMHQFWLWFHWNLSLRTQLTIFQHWFR